MKTASAPWKHRLHRIALRTSVSSSSSNSYHRISAPLQRHAAAQPNHFSEYEVPVSTCDSFELERETSLIKRDIELSRRRESHIPLHSLDTCIPKRNNNHFLVVPISKKQYNRQPKTPIVPKAAVITPVTVAAAAEVLSRTVKAPAMLHLSLCALSSSSELDGQPQAQQRRRPVIDHNGTRARYIAAAEVFTASCLGYIEGLLGKHRSTTSTAITLIYKELVSLHSDALMIILEQCTSTSFMDTKRAATVLADVVLLSLSARWVELSPRQVVWVVVLWERYYYRHDSYSQWWVYDMLYATRRALHRMDNTCVAQALLRCPPPTRGTAVRESTYAKILNHCIGRTSDLQRGDSGAKSEQGYTMEKLLEEALASWAVVLTPDVVQSSDQWLRGRHSVEPELVLPSAGGADALSRGCSKAANTRPRITDDLVDKRNLCTLLGHDAILPQKGEVRHALDRFAMMLSEKTSSPPFLNRKANGKPVADLKSSIVVARTLQDALALTSSILKDAPHLCTALLTRIISLTPTCASGREAIQCATAAHRLLPESNCVEVADYLLSFCDRAPSSASTRTAHITMQALMRITCNSFSAQCVKSFIDRLRRTRTFAHYPLSRVQVEFILQVCSASPQSPLSLFSEDGGVFVSLAREERQRIDDARSRPTSYYAQMNDLHVLEELWRQIPQRMSSASLPRHVLHAQLLCADIRQERRVLEHLAELQSVALHFSEAQCRLVLLSESSNENAAHIIVPSKKPWELTSYAEDRCLDSLNEMLAEYILETTENASSCSTRIKVKKLPPSVRDAISYIQRSDKDDYSCTTTTATTSGETIATGRALQALGVLNRFITSTSSNPHTNVRARRAKLLCLLDIINSYGGESPTTTLHKACHATEVLYLYREVLYEADWQVTPKHAAAESSTKIIICIPHCWHLAAFSHMCSAATSPAVVTATLETACKVSPPPTRVIRLVACWCVVHGVPISQLLRNILDKTD